MADADLWARWRPEIAKAAIGDHHTLESIEASLAERRALLWATPAACLVVEFHRFPGGAHACQVRWAAGSKDTVLAALADLEAEAKAMGCTEMLIEARPAWSRLLKDSGYDQWSVTTRKEF